MSRDENDERAGNEEARSDDALAEEMAEGLWLRFRDAVLVAKKLEEFVF